MELWDLVEKIIDDTFLVNFCFQGESMNMRGKWSISHFIKRKIIHGKTKTAMYFYYTMHTPSKKKKH